MEKQVHLHEFRVKFTRAQLRNFLAVGFLCFFAGDLSPESITLSTYYPAPSGVYNNLLTTGNTYLARDGGSVGIGTNAPQAALDVHGVVRVGNYNNPPTPVKGGIYFNQATSQFMGSTDGVTWSTLGGNTAAPGTWAGYCDVYTGIPIYPATSCFQLAPSHNYYTISSCASGWTLCAQTSDNPGSVTYTSSTECIKNPPGVSWMTCEAPYYWPYFQNW